VKVNANYTFTQVEEPLSRLIPKHKGNISLDYQATPRSFFTINYQFVDKRKAFFDGGTFTTKPFFRLLSVGQMQWLNMM
jgi:vitamin B12 transporter